MDPTRLQSCTSSTAQGTPQVSGEVSQGNASGHSHFSSLTPSPLLWEMANKALGVSQ